MGGRGDITPHCTGIFKCDGDLLWCPARSCPMTKADRARQGRPGLYTYSGSGSDYVDHEKDECRDYEEKKKGKKKKRRLLHQIERIGEWGGGMERTNDASLPAEANMFTKSTIVISMRT